MSSSCNGMEEKMKKKFLVTSLVSVMALALCACGNGTGGENAAVSADGAAAGEDAGPDGGAASENKTASEDDTASENKTALKDDKETAAAEDETAKSTAPGRHYSTITEVLDFGPNITKIILDTECELAGASLSPSQFEVEVTRTSTQGEDFEWPQFMGAKPEDYLNGTRTVTNLYLSDADGNPAQSGTCVTLEMYCHPMQGVGSTMCYDGHFNVSVDVDCIITQKEPIQTDAGTLEDMVFNQNDGNRTLYADLLKTGSFDHPDTPLSYVYYEPETADEQKYPLIIWLHGAGEGGSEPVIAATGNKVVNLITPEMQQYFGGAFLLAPQSPTYWMDNGSGQISLSGDSIYVDALDKLIKDFVETHPAVDQDRLYIGGCSNGGFMTMKMILHTPDRFAAAFPICEALPDAVITDEDIQSIVHLPIWFTHAKTDTTVRPSQFVIPTYERLVEAGNTNVHFTFWDKVLDSTGLYTTEAGAPFEYTGHWSWVPMLNNECTLDYDGSPVTIDGNPVTILEWMAAQKKA